MKKLLIFLFSILISFNSYGEWKEIGENINGTIYYIEMDKIKEHDGYVYWWYLSNFLKPIDSVEMVGMMSQKIYLQGDCEITRFKMLSIISYNQPMGEGEFHSSSLPNPEWNYAVPESTSEIMLDYVCDYVD